MKLPIHLDIQEDTIWTTYREEKNSITNVEDLKKFVERWKVLFPVEIKPEELNEKILEAVKTEKFDSVDVTKTPDGVIAINIILPPIIVKAMLAANKYVVPLNCAFIQMNGGLEAFEENKWTE